jgi:histidinol phosphatase-like PHP family hydrolase
MANLFARPPPPAPKVALHSNYDKLLQAVKKNGTALEFGSEELRANSKIVRSACQQDGMALAFAAER